MVASEVVARIDNDNACDDVHTWMIEHQHVYAEHRLQLGVDPAHIHQAFAMEYLKAALYIPIIMDLMTVDA